MKCTECKKTFVEFVAVIPELDEKKKTLREEWKEFASIAQAQNENRATTVTELREHNRKRRKLIQDHWNTFRDVYAQMDIAKRESPPDKIIVKLELDMCKSFLDNYKEPSAADYSPEELEALEPGYIEEQKNILKQRKDEIQERKNVLLVWENLLKETVDEVAIPRKSQEIPPELKDFMIEEAMTANIQRTELLRAGASEVPAKKYVPDRWEDIPTETINRAIGAHFSKEKLALTTNCRIWFPKEEDANYCTNGSCTEIFWFGEQNVPCPYCGCKLKN